jgi:O-antigen/teichoic acid export membrane protein
VKGKDKTISRMKYLSIFKNRLGSSSARNVLSTFGLRLTYTGLTLVTNIFLARLLTIHEFGVYTYAFTWISLLSIISTAGLENLVVREVALYKDQGAWDLLKGLLKRSDQIVLLVSSLISIIISLAAWHTWHRTDWTMCLAFFVTMIGLPPAALRNLRRGVMDGLSQVTLGFLSETLIAPLTFILFTWLAALYWGKSLNATIVLSIYSCITFFTLFISSGILKARLPKQLKDVTSKYKMRAWLKSAVPFIFLGSLYVISSRIDILMLGAIKGVEVSGLYVPVNRGAQLLTFIPAAIGRVLSSKLVQSHATGKIEELQKVMTKSSKVISFTIFPLVFAFILFSDYYLLLFGQEFLNGKTALIILCLGQFINALTGLPDILLNMTGNESYTAMISGIGVALNIALNSLLIPSWGIEGAASATAISIIFVAITNLIIVQRKLGINSAVISLY